MYLLDDLNLYLLVLDCVQIPLLFPQTSHIPVKAMRVEIQTNHT